MCLCWRAVHEEEKSATYVVEKLNSSIESIIYYVCVLLFQNYLTGGFRVISCTLRVFLYTLSKTFPGSV